MSTFACVGLFLGSAPQRSISMMVPLDLILITVSVLWCVLILTCVHQRWSAFTISRGWIIVDRQPRPHLLLVPVTSTWMLKCAFVPSHGRVHRSSERSAQIDDGSWWWGRCVMGNRGYNSLPAVTSCDWCGVRGHVEADPRAVILLKRRQEGQELKPEVDGPSAEWTGGCWRVSWLGLSSLCTAYVLAQAWGVFVQCNGA